MKRERTMDNNFQFPVKMIMAGVNIGCLLITLLLPNSSTPFSLLPILVMSVSWVFAANSSDARFGFNRAVIQFLAFTIVLAVGCCIIGATCKIYPNDPKQGTNPESTAVQDSSAAAQTENEDDENKKVSICNYKICIDDTVAIFGGKSFNYLYFASIYAVSTSVIIVSELIPASGNRSYDRRKRRVRSIYTQLWGNN